MLLSIDWLKEFTPYNGTIDDLAHVLTMIGLEVEEIRHPFTHLDQYVVGRVVSAHPHPNADKLSLCTVDLGQDQPVQIVCGAPNVASGQNVAVAPVGSTLPGGQSIQRVRIRGQESKGMILSEKEMDLGEDHTGIKVLLQDVRPGTPIPQALGLDTTFFDLGITPNRSDCLSVLGVAREVAAACNLPVHMPQVTLPEEDPDTNTLLQVQIDDPHLCPVYQARIIESFTLGPSPDWMRYRLLGMGLRPINNIVDITNYVMLELGQPLHAFDRQHISGNMIRVARAHPGQEFITLDDQKRILSENDLLIWDAKKPVALAGVMGGVNSEITSSSQDLILESAVFDPSSVRKTGRRLGLSSESAYRFERGVDQPGSAFALDRTAQLIYSLAHGRVLRSQVRSEPRPWQAVSLSFRLHRARDLLALDVEESFCRQTLANLGCKVQEHGSHWQVIPPSFRLDLQREVDLIEEIGRVYGLESIPTTLPRINKPLHPAPDPEKNSAGYGYLRQVKAWAQGQGLTEVINYSFVGAQEMDRLHLASTQRVPVHNPLSTDQDTLRTVLTPGLLRNVRTNADQGMGSCRLFEVARIFLADPDSETSVQEHTRLGLLLTGTRHPPAWPWEQAEADYLDLKGLIENLIQYFGLSQCRFTKQAEHEFLDPGVIIGQAEKKIGFLGRVTPEVAKGCHVRSAIWLAELNLDYLASLVQGRQTTYRPLAKFPPVHRDMTVIAGPEVAFAHIQTLIDRQAAQSLLEDVRLVDVYQPAQAPERHLTLRLRYRHAERTLTDKEVDTEHTVLGQALTTHLPLRFPST
ncbi:MAG: phenylalanine--tRNA ligase subunit beta [Desulfovermiculus sp.]|nr:phenylalanine--tRNA ligase subunit beta [Desulfovermiculus sp.]